MRRVIEDSVSLLAGAGIGLAVMYLMDPERGAARRRRIARGARETMASTGQALSDYAGSAGEAISRTARQASDAAASAWQGISESAGQRYSDARRSAREAASDAAESVGEASSSAYQRARDYIGQRLPRSWRQSSWRSSRLSESGSSSASRIAGITAGGVGLLALGAGGAWLFDPRLGRARRAWIRDKCIGLINDSGQLMRRMGRHLSNQARGTVAETRAVFRSDQPTDEQLCERVRSQIGRAGNVGAVHVEAHDGCVILSGSAPREQIEAIAAAARDVRGVGNVDCRISPSEAAATA